MRRKTLRISEKGKALKRYINDYSMLKDKETSDIEIWEDYLVYATILDTPKEIKKFFNKIFG